MAEYRERLYSVALALCHDETEAEDLVLRTLERIIEKIGDYQERDSFYNWACVIMLNLYRDSTRGKVVQGTMPVGGAAEMDALMEPVGAERIVMDVDSGIVRQVLERMPEDMREVLLLHYFMDMPVGKIAKFLAMPVGTIKSRLHYARLALAMRLGAKLKKPAVVLIVAALLLLGATAAVVAVTRTAVDGGAASGDAVPVEDTETGKGTEGIKGTYGMPDAVLGESFVSGASGGSDFNLNSEKGAGQMNIKNKAAAFVTAAATLGAVSAGAEPIGSGLAAYLTFDEAVVSNRILNSTITGVTLSDSGIASGVKSGEFGHSGFGGYLDIDQGWARLDGSQNLTFENGNDFTICIWMRMEDAQTGDPVFVGNGNWQTTGNPGVLLATATGSSGWVASLNYSVSGTSRVRVNSSDGGVLISMGKWAFYAISHTSDGKFNYYMSSNLGTLATICELDAPNFKLLFDSLEERCPFHIGQHGPGNYSKKFVGKIDEFALWTRGLSFSDINAIYQNGRKGHLLDDLLKPEMAVTDAGNGNIDISFAGVRSEDFGLYVASGAADGGMDRFAWDHFDYVTNVAPTDSSYTFALPEAFRNEGRYYRFFLTKAADCQEIEFLQNSETYASAWFHTGVNPNKDTTVVGEVEIVNGSTWDEIFGCCDSANKCFYHLGFYWGGKKWYTETKKLTGGGTLQFGEGTTGVRYAFDYGVTGVSCWNSSMDAASTYQETLSDRTVFPDMTHSIVVFRCEGQNGTTYDRSFQGKMYSLAISTNGTVACDYIPVKNVSGVAGFYDAATKTFIPSETETDFVGGAATVGRLTVQSATAKAMTASDPVTAYWVGGASGAIDDPDSWHCVNSYGEVIEVVPSVLTEIVISNAVQMFNVPVNSAFVCRTITIATSIALTDDYDWRGVDLAKITTDGTVNLNGHALRLAVPDDIGNTVSFTDLAGGGKLHVEVPASRTVDNTNLSLSGALALVKDGDGTLIANRQNQTFTGGVSVEGGTLKTTAFISTCILGPSGSKITVGNCGTLRVENGYTGLEDYDLELAGGTLYMFCSQALSGRSVIGSMTLSANSTLHLESVPGVGGDSTCDIELAEGAVWDLGGYELTGLFATTHTDFWIGKDKTVKPIFRNGTIILPSQVGYWQDWGSDAHDHVCYRYGMKNTRQRADSSTYDFVNNISRDANFTQDGTMSVYGTYTPSDTNLCMKIRMMDGSTINLAGRSNAMPTALDGPNNGSLRAMTFESGATINIEFGSRHLRQNEKVVSWSAIPAGITFVDPSRRWCLVVAEDGIYAVRGLKIIIR